MKVVLGLGVFALLSGCASDGEVAFRGYILPTKASVEIVGPLEWPQLASPSPLAAGDTFVLSNPTERWRVTSVSDGTVTWISSDGNYMLTPSLTFLPPLDWGGNGKVTDSGRRVFSSLSFEPGVADLTRGARYRFYEQQIHDRPPEVSSSYWECEIGEAAEIVVPAGKTEAVPVVCEQDGVERLLVNYSPSLGYIVRYALLTDAGPVIRELTGYQRGQSTVGTQ